jgi:hypothetical protein
MGTHLATERAGMVTLHLTVGAPELYPDHVRICVAAMLVGVLAGVKQ